MKSSGQSAAWHAQSSGFNLALNKPGLVCMPVISILRRLRQKDLKFKVILSHIERV